MRVSTALVVLALVCAAIYLRTDLEWASVCCVLAGMAWLAAIMFEGMLDE